ncbi:type II secretion system protein GspN [Bacteriovoracaceae bacterium]|nr:type II secretion system protein GspN [Bacteriovoracaceae bacterium]
MSKNIKFSESKIYDQYYKGVSKYKYIFPIFGIIFFALGAWINFPLSNIIHSTISSQILKNRSCPIHYDSLEIHYFLPKISISNVILNKKCLRTSQPMPIGDITLYFRGPSLFPLGSKFLLSAVITDSKLNAFFTLSLNETIIKIDDTKISLDSLKEIIDVPLLASGIFNIQALFKIYKSKKQEEIFVKISSENFHIPQQNIKSFAVPDLPFKKFMLKITPGKNSKIHLDQLLIGNSASPLSAQFTGSLKLNKSSVTYSSLDLSGQLNIEESFLERNSFINIFLSPEKFKPKDGEYQLTIKGPLASPQFFPSKQP